MKDTMSGKGAICPYCDHLHVPEDEEIWELYDPDCCGLTCTSCGEEFEVNVICSYTWVTEKTDEQEEIEMARRTAAGMPGRMVQ